jgi:hypothetical protein
VDTARDCVPVSFAGLRRFEEIRAGGKMEEDRSSSATVVLPDISETSGIPTANEELEARGQGVRVAGGNLVTVPVTVPVLTSVSANGTTFNVIAQDPLQLQSTEYKPVLCVDNRFVSLTKNEFMDTVTTMKPLK